MEEDYTVIEEEILLLFKEALKDEFPVIAEEINEKKKEDWIKPFENIFIGTTDEILAVKPLAILSLTKTKKKMEDRFVEHNEYTLTLAVVFALNTEEFTCYRYALALSLLIKNSELLKKAADRIVLEETVVHQTLFQGSGEFPQTEYVFSMERDDF